MKHVVVIGAGFAGLMALKQLVKSKSLKLTLINKDSYFLFTPRLTELLNDSISKKIVLRNISSIFGNKVNFIKGEAKYIDLKKKYVLAGKTKVSYNYLIMAQGATTNFFGNKSIEKNAMGYKGYNDVLKIKNKIRANIQKFSTTNKKELLAFAVVGAGLTGIELICSLRETAIKEIKKYENITPRDARFILMGASNDIAEQLNKRARLKIHKFLKRNNTEVMTGIKVQDVKKEAIITNNGRIKASTVIWAAGVKANVIKTSPELALDKGSTIKVDRKLRIPMYDNVYVGGDAALFIKDHKLLPQTAQVAFQEGVYIGKNILRRIKGKRETDFHYMFKGTLIILGSKYGIYANHATLSGKLITYFRHLFYIHRFWQIT